MKVRKVVRRKVERSENGIDVVGSLNAVVAATMDEPGSSVSVSSTQRSSDKSREEHE